MKQSKRIVINVQITKREFRNPARESKKEEEWLRQKAKALPRSQVKDDLQMDHSEIIGKHSHLFRIFHQQKKF